METISNEVLPVKPTGAGFINKAFFTKLMGVMAILASSAYIYYHYFTTNRPEHTQLIPQTVAPVPTTPAKSIAPATQETVTENKVLIAEAKQEPTQSAIEPIVQQPEPPVNESPKHHSADVPPIYEDKKIKPEDSSYVFPKLTDKEIKETAKQKSIMAGLLVKPNKYWYPLIGDKQNKIAYGTINDTGSVFYMARSEVTNLEYRTFLFDLLIHGEKDAFLKAKPHQELWLNAPGHAKGKLMKASYFSDKIYNDYPVVNITPEGAELYCEWLSNLTQSNNGKIIARLPYENEWVKAAKHKDVATVYPWPGDSIQNRMGCFLANFCIQKQSEKLRPNHHIKCSAKNTNAYASAEYMLGDSMMTTKVFAYNPNDNGLYCMVGNVAEMVYSNKTKTVITKGGSWNSDFEQCKLYNKEELNGPIKANPMTGFRPLFRITQTHSFGSIQRENPATGLATLTTEETATAQKEKKKMIEALIKANKEKYAYIPMGSFLYKKDTFSVQAFYMETTEVTNLEYRTFLADLLLQNRTADYLVAKPDQQMWTTRFSYSYNEPMTTMYFWHPAYDEYPVVNVSRKGAQLYCNWLTIEANKVLKDNNKPLINDLRLPADLEWAYAASNGKNYAKYANGNEFLRDSKGKYEANYMCYSKDECKYDSVMKLYVPKIFKQAYVEDGLFHTGYTKSYVPNSYGLYCMAGNASEMVSTYDKATNTYLNKGIKGGNWFSCDYFLEIDADDEYPNEVNASPLIGFRPVMTAVKK
ncbi:MAG: SUMF1/EgtB/PvdO family nonheme iron enzyme [Bacteroidetes bacterium]|nr:SUMF1/EgtB/PvdO family nonheme iron enzyme [Bacteroidota bacterium]